MPSSFLSAATLALSSRIRSPTSIILLELWCHLSSSTGSSMSGDHQSKIDQCELLATLCALMSFPDLLQGPEILFWTDNIGTLKACVDGHTKSRNGGSCGRALLVPRSPGRSGLFCSRPRAR